ncbi:MAG: hypothetical protein ACYTGQ_01035, partial [Planctomycetota bacterium]
ERSEAVDGESVDLNAQLQSLLEQADDPTTPDPEPAVAAPEATSLGDEPDNIESLDQVLADEAGDVLGDDFELDIESDFESVTQAVSNSMLDTRPRETQAATEKSAASEPTEAEATQEPVSTPSPDPSTEVETSEQDPIEAPAPVAAPLTVADESRVSAPDKQLSQDEAFADECAGVATDPAGANGDDACLIEDAGAADDAFTPPEELSEEAAAVAAELDADEALAARPVEDVESEAIPEAEPEAVAVPREPRDTAWRRAGQRAASAALAIMKLVNAPLAMLDPHTRDMVGMVGVQMGLVSVVLVLYLKVSLMAACFAAVVLSGAWGALFYFLFIKAPDAVPEPEAADAEVSATEGDEADSNTDEDGDARAA